MTWKIGSLLNTSNYYTIISIDHNSVAQFKAMSSASPWPPSGPCSAPKIGIYQPAHGRIENALAPKDMETWEHRILLDMDILSASSDLSNFNAPWSQWTLHSGPHVATKLESLELMITSASVKLPIASNHIYLARTTYDSIQQATHSEKLLQLIVQGPQRQRPHC